MLCHVVSSVRHRAAFSVDSMLFIIDSIVFWRAAHIQCRHDVGSGSQPVGQGGASRLQDGRKQNLKKKKMLIFLSLNYCHKKL